MDKKTLKRIIENLRKVGLVLTKNFKVTIYQANESDSDYISEHSLVGTDQLQHVVKTIILAPDCMISDEQLMQDNETIANPTNKKQTSIKTRS